MRLVWERRRTFSPLVLKGMLCRSEWLQAALRRINENHQVFHSFPCLSSCAPQLLRYIFLCGERIKRAKRVMHTKRSVHADSTDVLSVPVHILGPVIWTLSLLLHRWKLSASEASVICQFTLNQSDFVCDTLRCSPNRVTSLLWGWSSLIDGQKPWDSVSSYWYKRFLLLWLHAQVFLPLV